MSLRNDPHAKRRKIRCAIYTRKSTEDGLEQDFNSLDAQREACEAYITSQKAEGWVLVADHFDDGGLSGGTLDRPALRRLLQAIETRQIDQVVIYKIDRLTRSLSDFSKIVDRLDTVGATFVSVTQAFNTATSMGRLTLNMLLSFAQFEREVTAERIRDKIAASKKKGLWMGGSVPLGYLADGRTLKIDPVTSPTVLRLYELYREHRSISAVTERARIEGLMSRRLTDATTGARRGGNPLSRVTIYQMLTNPIYAGRIKHHKAVYEGQHAALIEPTEWDALQAMISDDAARQRGVGNTGTVAALLGKIYDEHSVRLTPTHTKKSGKRIRYYISRSLVSEKAEDYPEAWRLPAVAFEDQIALLVQTRLADARIIARLLPNGTASELKATSAQAKLVVRKLEASTSDKTLELVERVDLGQGVVAIRVDLNVLCKTLDVDQRRIDAEQLTWSQPLSFKRRGVEARLIIGSETAAIDHALLRNVQQARTWYQLILDGYRYGDVAHETGSHRDHIKKMICLAFLAPDLLAKITTGNQPLGFTSAWVKTNGLPVEWPAQRALFKSL